jgi:hypothetical protein
MWPFLYIVAFSICASGPALADNNRIKDARTKSPLATCSSSWIESLYEQCDGRPTGDCYRLLEEARRLLVTQRERMKKVLVNPEEFVTVEEIWNKYRNAECAAIDPQCPEGRSGSCSTPTAICDVLLGCEHVIHLRATECRTSGYNRSLDAPDKPSSCK